LETLKVLVFLDTDVLVDILRGSKSAEKWLQDASAESFQIPAIVAMELVAGCQDKADLRRVHRFIAAFGLAWPQEEEVRLAYDFLVEYRLSTGIGIPDCLIAAMALKRSATLLSFNSKHFKTIPGLDLREPYSRYVPRPD
jgi:predicted nucleic acid-binding protein